MQNDDSRRGWITGLCLMLGLLVVLIAGGVTVWRAARAPKGAQDVTSDQLPNSELEYYPDPEPLPLNPNPNPNRNRSPNRSPSPNPHGLR